MKKLLKKLIKFLYFRYWDELHVPTGTKIAQTYNTNGKRGIIIYREGHMYRGNWMNFSEEYLEMPKDLLK